MLLLLLCSQFFCMLCCLYTRISFRICRLSRRFAFSSQPLICMHAAGEAPLLVLLVLCFVLHRLRKCMQREFIALCLLLTAPNARLRPSNEQMRPKERGSYRLKILSFVFAVQASSPPSTCYCCCWGLSAHEWPCCCSGAYAAAEAPAGTAANAAAAASGTPRGMKLIREMTKPQLSGRQPEEAAFYSWQARWGGLYLWCFYFR